MSKFINRVGETSINKYGSRMTIIEYNNNQDMIVEFENGWKTHSAYSQFQIKTLKSPYDKSIYGIGYIGEGKYKVSENGVHTKEYDIWKDMFYRCYTEKCRYKLPTYKDCTVCDEWHNFQNFAQWYEENFYTIEGQTMCLDKDILHKGNKIYSSNNCIFVPKSINSLFVKCDASRGKLPIGVCFDKEKNKYLSSGKKSNGEQNERRFLGYFNTPEEAFYKYKIEKEKYIKQKADQYKDKIPKKLYNAMYNYIVEITD